MRACLTFALAASCAITWPQSGLTVDPGRSPGELRERADQAVRAFGRNAAALTRSHREALGLRGRFDPGAKFSLPTFIRTGLGAPLGRGVGDITLAFDASGPRAFPTAYRDLLQSVFDQAKPALNAVFGQPNVPGTVFVRNYDADIGDRDAVAGGYFIPNNGSGEMEIAFPIYNLDESAAVNFVHTLLLAYQGSTPYFFDAFEEGLVRAAAMKVVRTPGAMPATLDAGLMESIIESTYDVGPFYDWYNQKALAGPLFIAPNLRTTPLPPGGSTGGLYLLRYQMSGSAWQKVLAEYPGFIAEFNSRYYAQPGIASDVPALVALGQTVLNFLRPGDPTVEGLSFAEWFKRQAILQTQNAYGLKLLMQPTPVVSGLGGPDYGVFDIWVQYFETRANGDEILLSGTSFPIFWEDSFNRFSSSSQEDRMSIAGAFGSITPNFENLFGEPYRATVDIPVQDQIARAYLPAGAIATASSPLENDFYGTVVGGGFTGGSTGRVDIYAGPSLLAQAPVTRGAFGVRINQDAFLRGGAFIVKVMRITGQNQTEIMTRKVNKGPGALALDLRVDGDVTYLASLGKGINAFALPLDPFSVDVPGMLALAPGDVLAARYNAALARYDLFPEMEPFKEGHGYFVRMPAAATFPVQGRTSPGTPVAVALRPGWNMVGVPFNETAATSRVQVIKGTDLPKAFADALGVEIGTEFFRFLPGAPDPATGAPETGTMLPATSFQAGQMLFVRVFSPEGVTLLFSPTTSLRPGGREREAAATQPMTAGPRDWQVRLTLKSREGLRTIAAIGQSATATRAFDRREDSGLPTGLGGFQIWLDGPEALFRDVRNIAQPETFVLRMDGLEVGRSYTLQLERLFGPQRWVQIFDPRHNRTRTVSTSGTFDVTATGPSMSLRISVKGNGL